jgi:hypothetical protein
MDGPSWYKMADTDQRNYFSDSKDLPLFARDCSRSTSLAGSFTFIPHLTPGLVPLLPCHLDEEMI